MSGFQNGRILTETDWLKEHLGDANVRILDVRASDPRLPIGYRMGHIPGAVELDPSVELYVFANGAAELASPEQIGRALGQRGISNDTSVIVYDEWTGQLAALTYWVLRYVGHTKLSILHGGWAAWRQSGGPATREVPIITPAQYHPETDADARATAEWIQKNASRPDVLLLDVRTPDEYYAGHIPGAINLPYDTSLNIRTQTFKEADVLKRQLESAGIEPDKDIVTYCAAGSRSAHMFVTLQLLGYPRVRNYEGSMKDWYKRHLQVE